jgi:hypothetical protein
LRIQMATTDTLRPCAIIVRMARPQDDFHPAEDMASLL